MTRTRKFLIAAVALMMLPLVPIVYDQAMAGKPIFSASIQMLFGNDTLRTQTPTDIGIDSHGRIYVVYRSDQTFFYGAYITHSDDDGRSWSRPVRIDDILKDGNASNDDSHKKLITPRMAIGPDDKVYVVWDDWRSWNEEPTLTQPADIRISVSSDGTNFSASRKVDPPKSVRTWDAVSPDIEINDAGRLVCVWLDKKDAGAYINVWSSYSDDGGSTWSDALLLNHDGLYYRNHHNPRIAMHGNDVYVVWQDDRNTTLGTMPYIAVSLDGGQSFSEERPFTDDVERTNRRTFAYPAVDGAGNLYIAWNDLRSKKPEIYFTRSEDKGATFSPNARVQSVPDLMGDNYPCIATRGTGRLMLTWNRSVEYEIYRESEAFFINSTDGGRTWGGMLRVDDTDRFEVDRTNQESVLCIYNNEGRPLCVWTDSRNYQVGAPYRDLFFTRYSQSLTGPNTLPLLLLPGFYGGSSFSTVIGNTSTIYNFTLTYKDEDNDMPGAGFPRLMIYRDVQGSDPYLSDWLVMVRTRGEKDFYFMDGVDYHVETSIAEKGQFYWKVEINDGVAPDLISTPIKSGPLIDTEMPTLEILGPEERTWFATNKVECRVRVRDTGGAGVDPYSIKYRRSVRGPDSFEKGVQVSSFLSTDNDTFEGWADVTFDPGDNNYVSFEAKDRVGNGIALSGHINIWLDPEVPYYTDPRPTPRELQIYADVNCSIIWRDSNPGSTLVANTGLDPSTIMCAYRTTTGPFSEWRYPDGVKQIANDSYRAWVHFTFLDEGVYNYVKWKASDRIGNTAESEQLRLNVNVPPNYRPVFRGKGMPDAVGTLTPHIWWEPPYDEEGDPIFYRVMLHKMPGTLPLTGWIDVGMNEFYDIPDTEALTPGTLYMLRINATDGIGGYDILDHQFKVLGAGLPPPSDIGVFGPYNSTDSNITVQWPASTMEGGFEVTYRVRVGRTEKDDKLLGWTDNGVLREFNMSSLRLGIGIYSFQVVSFANNNFSRVSSTRIKISDYRVRVDVPETHEVYRGKGITKSKPMKANLVNLGTYEDNVTVILQGELVEKGWAYLELVESTQYSYSVESSKGKASEVPREFRVIVAPPENAQKRDYVMRIRVVTEDGRTGMVSKNITVKVSDAPAEDGEQPLSDDIVDLLKTVLPFLRLLPDQLVIPGFLVFLVLIVVAIVTVGMVIFTKRKAREKARDPMAERKRLYRELYGKEASEDEIKQWETEEVKKEGAPASPAEGAPPAPSPAPGKQVEGKGDANAPKKEKALPTGENLDREDKELLDKLFDN